MKNETYDTRLIKEWDAEPLEGYHVVVFERMGTKGERFHIVLPPGTPMAKPGLLKSVFGRKANHFGIAVQAAPELHIDWSEHVVTADHVHELDLLFTLYYCVEDPKLVATTRVADPLWTVRRKVGAVIAGEMAEVPWKNLWHSFRAAADTVVQDNLRPLRAFAAQYGLSIRSIGLGLQLPEGETSTPREVERGIIDKQLRTGLELVTMDEDEVIQRHRTETDARLRGHALRQAQQNDGLEMHALVAEQQRQLLRDISGANSTALGNIGRKIESATEWRDALRAGKSALREMMGDGGAMAALGSGTSPAMLGSGGDPELTLAPHTAQPSGGLVALVADVVAATEEVTPDGTRDRLRAAVLHLVAEVLADGDDVRLEEYAKEAQSQIARLHPPPSEEVLQVLRTLAEPDHVYRALKRV